MNELREAAQRLADATTAMLGTPSSGDSTVTRERDRVAREAYNAVNDVRTALAAPRALEGPPQFDEFRADADYLARDVLNRFGDYAHPVGHEDETHEDCVIRAAQRIHAFPALGGVSRVLPEPTVTEYEQQIAKMRGGSREGQ